MPLFSPALGNLFVEVFELAQAFPQRAANVLINTGLVFLGAPLSGGVWDADLVSAGGGDRTRMGVTPQGILSPLRLPVSPPRPTGAHHSRAVAHLPTGR